MRSRRFRLGLLLTVVVSLGSCEINPQPELPNRSPGSNLPDAGGSAPVVGTGGTGLDISNGGTLTLDPGGGNPQGSAGGPATPMPRMAWVARRTRAAPVAARPSSYPSESLSRDVSPRPGG
jgi:hypothetical protein